MEAGRGSRITECLRFADEFLSGPTSPAVCQSTTPSQMLYDLSLPATLQVDPARLRPSEGRLQDHGVQTDAGNVEHHPTIDPRKVIAPETLETLRRSRHEHMPLRINENLNTRITNTVHSTEFIDTRTGLQATLPLNQIARALLFLASQYNTERFAKLVQRYGPSIRLTQLIFATGKIVETGRVSFEGKRAQMLALVDLIHATGLPHIAIGRRICQNIVSTGKLNFPLRLWLLKLRFDGVVVYNPTEFAGAIIRHAALNSLLEDDNEDMDTGGGDLHATTGVHIPVDSVADERLDDPEAMAAATEYAHNIMQLRGDFSSPEDIARLVDEKLTRQRRKNIVVLAFAVGIVICGGAKNVRMLRRAYALVYEMLHLCRDTPENRALEAQLLYERGIVPGTTHVPSISEQQTLRTPAPMPTSMGPKSRSRKRAVPMNAPMGGSGIVKRRPGRPRKNPATPRAAGRWQQHVDGTGEK